MDKLLKKDSSHFQVQSKAMDIKRDESGEIKSIVLEGYASTKNKDRVNDIVLPSAFEKALDLYMKNPRVFLQHDSSKNVGKTIEARINAKGLYVKTEIMLNMSLDGTDEVRLFDAIEKGLYKTYSIGYRVNEVEEKEVKQEGVVVGYERIIKDLDLMEISLVSVPANPYALIKSIEDCLPENTKMDKEQGIEQIKELTGEAEVVEEEKQAPAEEEVIAEEVVEEEVVEEETEESAEEEVVEEKEIEVEVKEEETVEPTEPVSEEVDTDSEEVEEVEETENSDEISEDADEKSQIVEETKEIETQEEVVAEVKDYDAMVKSYEEKLETLAETSTKEMEELRTDTKEIADGFLDLIEQFKELKAHTKSLEEVMSKIVIKKGYTHEQKQQTPVSKFGSAIKAAQSL